ncbi:hypothetical protein F66182_8079 [Fusarium sp. NRRL 66182]|nr:hypothetical protein F66182_8079 [Fusarium sp. NRRL 66182]
MSDPDKPPIYPRYCFHLAPTFNRWCFLRVADIHGLDQHGGFEGENFYFHRNLPIKWVRIVGLVVAIDEFYGRRVYTIDDSSGVCIECAIVIPAPGGIGSATTATTTTEEAALNKKVDESTDVGSVVYVKGSLSTFRDERQINVVELNVVRSTAQEVALWEKRNKFQADVLDKSWTLRNRDIRTCRKEAEKDEEQAERKQKRIKAMVEPRAAKQPARSADQEHRNVKQQQLNKAARSDLRHDLEHRGRGKYDALGL